jgi:chromosome segregation ATPase
MASSYLSQFTSPAAKLVRCFEKSRDRWKAKYAEWKKRCKLLSNQTRAVERSRERWRERAYRAEKRLAELERECPELKWSPELAGHG